MNKSALVFLFFFAFAHIPLFAIQNNIATGKRRVAVFPFEINSPRANEKWLAGAFPETLTSALTQVRSLLLVERGDLNYVLEEQKLGLTGAIDPKTAVKTGKILGIQTGILGAFSRVGQAVRVTCRLVDMETAAVDEQHVVVVTKMLRSDEELLNVMDDLTSALIKTFNIRVTPEEIKQAAMRASPTQNYSAYEFYARGNEQLLLYDIEGYVKAVPHFQKAIQTDPKYALAYAALAETYYYWGAHRKVNGEESQSYIDLCYENAQKALKLRPDLAESHRALAYSYAAGKSTDMEAGKKASQKAVELNPNDAASRYVLWLANGSNLENPNISAALALNPRFIPAHITMGIELLDKGRYEEALLSFKKAIAIQPRNTYSYINMGLALVDRGFQYKDKGLQDEAISYFKKAIEINPNFYPAYTNLGRAYAYKGLYDEAIAAFKKAIEIYPKAAIVYFNLGMIFFNYKNLNDEAVPYFQKAIELDPQYPRAHYNLGIIFANKGLFDDAVSYLNQAIEIDHQDAMSHYSLGLSFEKMDRVPEAYRAWNKFLDLTADDPEYSDLTAQVKDNLENPMYKSDGLEDEVITFLKQKIRDNPQNADAYCKLGLLLAGESLFNAAILNYRKAIELDPRLDGVYNTLGLALFVKGDRQGGIENWKRACSLGDQRGCDNLRKFGQ